MKDYGGKETSALDNNSIKLLITRLNKLKGAGKLAVLTIESKRKTFFKNFFIIGKPFEFLKIFSKNEKIIHVWFFRKKVRPQKNMLRKSQ